MSQNATGNEPQDALQFHTVVVGAGVAGLYCSWRLSRRSRTHTVGLFEGSNRFGGRIETEHFGPFLAEFGPMRFEKPGQRKLMELLDNLSLETIKFAPYQAERPDFPVYDLRDHEKGPPPFDKRYTTLELLKLGIIRVLKDTDWHTGGDLDNPHDPKHDERLKQLDEYDYAAMRRRAKQGDEYLYDLGLWNALSNALSHQALMKIRDLGTFYHLIPENPNAIEWIIFWLRGLDPKDNLVSVKGGSKRITECLLDRLDSPPCRGRVRSHLEHTLTEIKPQPKGKVLLKFDRRNGDPVWAQARHVILGLPKSPLEKLAEYFRPQTRKDLDAVFGIPLLKCFFLVRNPWWDKNTKPQTRASLMPTREVHYYYDEEKSRDQGLVMLYTDRPATEFWKLYVKGEVHDRAEIDGDQRLKRLFFKYLARYLRDEADKYPIEALEAATDGVDPSEDPRAADALSPAEAGSSSRSSADINNLNFSPSMFAEAREKSEEELTENLAERVVKFGIRDWSREPYGAAAHTWKPKTKSWEVLERLQAFSLSDEEEDPRNIHICGEAYSDYHGFIEGALRSADDVLRTIR